MSKIPQGILGGMSGKIGGVVGSSWKGINVLKTKPLSVANPNTAGQIAQRTKFTNVQSFAKVILATVIKPLWDRFASKMSGFNAFIQENINLFATEYPFPVENLVISKGKMAATAIDSAVSSEAAKTVTVDWTDDSGDGYKLATDEAYLVIICNGDFIIAGFATGITRAAQQAVVNLNVSISETEDAYAYLAFRRADGTIVSNTSYLKITANA